MLAAATKVSVSQDGETTCEKGLAEAGLDGATTVAAVQVWGRVGQAVMGNDVVFLTIEDGHWRITAAGCQARSGRPYQCAVEGG